MSELSPETEELLARGREGTPLSTSRRDALKGAVLAKLTIGAGAAATSLATTSSSAAAWTMTTKTIGVAVIAAVIGTGTVGVVKYQRSAHSQAPAQTISTTVAANPAADPAATVATIPTPMMSAAVNSEAPQSLPVVQPTPEIAPVVTANAQTTQPIAQNSSAPISHVTSAVTGPVLGDDAPNAVNSPAIATSPNSGAGNATTPSTTPHASSLAEGNALLVAAKQALDAKDPARALRLLDEHATRFPNSPLEPERSAERVFAFCAEQKTDAAHDAAASFLSAHPTGPLAARVRASCGGH